MTNARKENDERLKAFEDVVRTAQKLMVGSVYSHYDRSTIDYEDAKAAFMDAAAIFLRKCAEPTVPPDK